MIIRLLHKNPYIIYLPSSDISSENTNILRKHLYKEKVYFIVYSNGYISDHIAQEYSYLIRPKYRNADHNFIFLANSQEELSNYEKVKINTRFINHNAFIDPKLFYILDIEKKYKAIYNARFSFLKRHYLASKIDNCACICWGFFKDYERPLYEDLKNKQNIILLNKIINDKIVTQTPKEVNIAYNNSYVGLCLSSQEGAMYSSIEYLLSGIPVVSTFSVGGRDIFFDNYNSIITNDDPVMVADAVKFFIDNANNISRVKIRNDAIAKQQIFINNFKGLISYIFKTNHIDINMNQWWKNNYSHKIVKTYKDIDTFMKNL